MPALTPELKNREWKVSFQTSSQPFSFFKIKSN